MSQQFQNHHCYLGDSPNSHEADQLEQGAGLFLKWPERTQFFLSGLELRFRPAHPSNFEPIPTALPRSRFDERTLDIQPLEPCLQSRYGHERHFPRYRKSLECENLPHPTFFRLGPHHITTPALAPRVFSSDT